MRSNLKVKACITHEVVVSTLEAEYAQALGSVLDSSGRRLQVGGSTPTPIEVAVCQVCGALFHPDYLPGE